MGQKLREDKIGTLSHNAGVIGLTNSYLTIGGQQYSTGALSRTITADVTLTANSLYMIYAVLVSGVPALRISSNVNSVGPAGFSAWKLVGAFYSNGSSAFGSFVNIEGVPRSNSTFYAPVLSWVAGVGFNVSYWQRNGENAEIFGYIELNGSPTAANLTFDVPSNLLIDNAKIPGGAGNIRNSYGSATLLDSGTRVYTSGIFPLNTSTFQVSHSETGNFGQVNATNPFTWVSGDGVGFNIKVPISGWSNTPLKDL